MNINIPAWGVLAVFSSLSGSAFNKIMMSDILCCNVGPLKMVKGIQLSVTRCLLQDTPPITQVLIGVIRVQLGTQRNWSTHLYTVKSRVHGHQLTKARALLQLIPLMNLQDGAVKKILTHKCHIRRTNSYQSRSKKGYRTNRVQGLASHVYCENAQIYAVELCK